MSLSRAKRLQPVVEMAEKAEREAARQLGHCQGLVGQAEAKLGELERFRGDYQQQWISEGSKGVSGQWLMNYQRFLSQLETAVGQQQQVWSGIAPILKKYGPFGSNAMRVSRGCANWSSATLTKPDWPRTSANRNCSTSWRNA